MAQPDDSRNQQMTSSAELEDSSTDPSEQPIETEEFWRTVELCSWASLAFLPVLYFVNGPAVSTDQLIIRSIVVIAVVAGVITSLLRRVGRVLQR